MNENKSYYMIRKRDDQQKLSVTKRHLTTLLILSINNNISKPAFLSTRTPSTSEFREGCGVLYHALSSGKEMGNMGASKPSSSREMNWKKKKRLPH